MKQKEEKTLKQLFKEYELKGLHDSFFDYLYDLYFIGQFSEFTSIYFKELSDKQKREFFDFVTELLKDELIKLDDYIQFVSDMFDLHLKCE